jgi:tRNA nucleotidyltransferase (CCA-adding enzyme)
MIKNLQKLNSDFEGILGKLCELSSSKGCNIYLVGGVARDLFLGKRIFDLDIVVEGDAIGFAQIFAQHNDKEFRKHHVFGTATVYLDNRHIDFVTARKETYKHWGALPKVEPAALKEDLLRRDFTINAMAISLNKSNYGKLVDFYGGLTDLKNGLIRILHKDSFLQDPTRIMRAIRFEQRFSFRIEHKTLHLLKDAVAKGALSFINPHRLRDELILMLKEEQPLRYIKRAAELGAFSVIDKNFKLTKNDLRLIYEIEKAISLYGRKFKNHRQLDEWLIYLAVLLAKVPTKDISKFLQQFGLRKGENMRVLSIFRTITRIKKLNKPLSPKAIYQFLNPLSFEDIIFFYAYYRLKKLRKNIEIFLNTLVHIRLKVRGQDLKNLGYKPYNLYGRIFEKLLYAKINKGLRTKAEELKEAKSIFEKLSR